MKRFEPAPVTSLNEYSACWAKATEKSGDFRKKSKSSKSSKQTKSGTSAYTRGNIN